MTKKRLGVLGGTFDPIHNGHLYSAQAIYEAMKLEKIIFIPAFIPPHKLDLKIAPAGDRYRMTELATEPYADFEVSDIELKRSGVSYTIDTVRELRALYPEYELYFIIGADSVPLLHTWKKIEELLQEVTFVAADRPGYSQVIDEACRHLGQDAKKHIILLDTPEYAVSSTEIRRRIRCGKSLAGLVPQAVERYIGERRLYQQASKG